MTAIGIRSVRLRGNYESILLVLIIKRAEYEVFAKRIFQFYKCHGKTDTIRHFPPDGDRKLPYIELYSILKKRTDIFTRTFPEKNALYHQLKT